MPDPSTDPVGTVRMTAGLIKVSLVKTTSKRLPWRRLDYAIDLDGVAFENLGGFLDEQVTDFPIIGAVPGTPAAAVPAPLSMRTLHVTTTRDIPEGHTDQRVRYQYEGDSWDAWFIAFGKGENGQEAYLMRDNGERWVVMADNITGIDSAAALAALREEQR